jgi:hypothetical protein
MTIQKTKIEIVVFMEADTPEEAQATLSGMELDRISEAMTEGEFVGSVNVGATETIADEDVSKELEAIGSDASFFGDYDAGGESEGESQQVQP